MSAMDEVRSEGESVPPAFSCWKENVARFLIIEHESLRPS